MSTESTLVADRYRLLEMLHVGGMVIVWRAWDERLHRPVAVRILRVEPRIGGAERQQAADRAMRAGRQAAELQHPHVVAVIDVVDHNGHPCFVTPLIESTPLALVLRERGTLRPSEAAGIGAQVASALAAAHTMSIVHGGVDPDCVALTPDGSAMVGDFGMALALRESTGAPGSACTAPEVAKGRTPGYAADVYSLGVMLYEMVEGTTPFGQGDDAAGPRTFAGRYRRPEHAGSLAPLLRRMLAEHPKRRPSMASTVDSLSAAADDSDDDAFALLGLTTATPPIAETERSIDDTSREPLGLRPAALAAVPSADAVTERLEPHPSTRTGPSEPGTRPLRVGAAAPIAVGKTSATAPAWKGGPPAGPSRRRRRGAGVIAGILILLVALPVGAALLLDPLARDVGAAAFPAPPSLTAVPVPDVPPSPSSAPAPDPAATPAPGIAPQTPSTVAPPRAVPSETAAPVPSEPAPPPAEQSAPPATSEQQIVDMIAGYYALVPGDLDTAWGYMTDEYQRDHAGGLGGYEGFWSAIQSVEIAGVTATAPDQALATLTYHFYDGRVVEELTSFRLVDEGGVLKIADSAVLSSRQL